MPTPKDAETIIKEFLIAELCEHNETWFRSSLASILLWAEQSLPIDYGDRRFNDNDDAYDGYKEASEDCRSKLKEMADEIMGK